MRRIYIFSFGSGLLTQVVDVVGVEIALDTFSEGVASELLQESFVGIDLYIFKAYLVPASQDHVDDLTQTILILFDKVSDDNRHASAHPHLAVHQNVGLFPCFFDELISLIKESMQLVIFVVLSWNVEIMGYIFFGVTEKPAPSD